jgi:hypothetical protein
MLNSEIAELLRLTTEKQNQNNTEPVLLGMPNEKRLAIAYAELIETVDSQDAFQRWGMKYMTEEVTAKVSEWPGEEFVMHVGPLLLI